MYQYETKRGYVYFIQYTDSEEILYPYVFLTKQRAYEEIHQWLLEEIAAKEQLGVYYDIVIDTPNEMLAIGEHNNLHVKLDTVYVEK